MSRDTLGTNIVFFMLGAAAGAAVALLYAPHEGEKTRRIIGEKATEVKDKVTSTASNVVQQARDVTTNVTEQARGHVEKLTARAQEIINRGRDGSGEPQAEDVSALSEAV